MLAGRGHTGIERSTSRVFTEFFCGPTDFTHCFVSLASSDPNIVPDTASLTLYILESDGSLSDSLQYEQKNIVQGNS